MTTAKSSKKRGKGWFRFVIYLILLVIAFLGAGFVTFARHIHDLSPPIPVPEADGVVVWTGKGGGRLETGAELLRQGLAERLLVSGVNASLKRDDVLALLKLPEDLEACCVDLDYAAKDTIGNARETASWSRAMGYEHIILVTSAYHMPRAEVEIAAVAGRIRITPYPVAAKTRQNWWSDGPTFRRISQEYGKLLLTYMRDPGRASERGSPVLETPVEEPETGEPN